MKDNKHAQESVQFFATALSLVSNQLANNSAPFFSPRYAAHMNSDTTLPAMLGYLIGMLYNQNNVAPEGGPLTTLLEHIVGKQLCHMLGFGLMYQPGFGVPPSFVPPSGTHHGNRHKSHHGLDHGHDHNKNKHGLDYEHEFPGKVIQTNVEPWGHLTAGGSISNLEAMW